MIGLTSGLPLALSEGSGTFWFTKGSGSIAASSDLSFYVIFWISFFFFWAITIGMAVIMVRYRKRPGWQPKPGPTHNNALEITWTIIPLLLVIPIFWWGFKGYLNLSTPPSDAYQINVTAQKWTWLFEYPTGLIAKELHFPTDKPVTLTMSSKDVLHSLFIPDFRVKQDVVPGRYTKLWFETDEPGKHHLFCTEYCGKDHSTMITWAVAQTSADFDAWMEEQLDPSDKPLAGYGEELYKLYGCATCHSLDGVAGTGPSFKDLFGNQSTFTDGTSLTADENYIRQSVLEPMAHIREGYQPVMPTFKGMVQDDQIRALIAFIKLQSAKVPEGEKDQLRTNTVGATRDGAAGSPAGETPPADAETTAGEEAETEAGAESVEEQS